jgi:ethanolamine utilization protein EutA (predicted chaperonin)
MMLLHYLAGNFCMREQGIEFEAALRGTSMGALSLATKNLTKITIIDVDRTSD